tara:strand:- start:33342 stop:33806 length:465 start_codon:yes stop_codon:yes gene_type:complete
MKDYQDIIDLLPYTDPFLFVDEIQSINENEITGLYRIKTDEYFFKGHFPGNPVVPGVILIEIMAQIGLVSFGISLQKPNAANQKKNYPVFTSSKVDFLNIVKPGDQLKVHSKKLYFRFNKLKCSVECVNMTTGKIVCRGEMDGLILNEDVIERK